MFQMNKHEKTQSLTMLQFNAIKCVKNYELKYYDYANVMNPSKKLKF